MPVTAAEAAPAPAHTDWGTLSRLFPYLWDYKVRVIAALLFMKRPPSVLPKASTP